MDITVVLPSFYVQQFGELVEDLGGDFKTCLASANLEPAVLKAPLAHFTLAECKQVALTACTQTQQPALGLLLGERLLVHTHGVLGYAALNASTLAEALAVLEQFIRVRVTVAQLSLQQTDNNAQLVLLSDAPLGLWERFLSEAVLMAVKQIVDFITQDKRAVTAVAFRYPVEEQAELAEKILGCPVLYEQPWTGLNINPEFLHKPLQVAEPAMFEVAQRLCAEALSELNEEESLSQRIRRYLLARHNEFPGLEVICRQFHITPRTLHRHLQEENTTFRAITDEVKHQLALQHLKEHSLKEAAYLLGYSDLANFRRAFKRWEGVSPTEYLQRVAETNKPFV